MRNFLRKRFRKLFAVNLAKVQGYVEARRARGHEVTKDDIDQMEDITTHMAGVPFTARKEARGLLHNLKSMVTFGYRNAEKYGGKAKRTPTKARNVGKALAILAGIVMVFKWGPALVSFIVVLAKGLFAVVIALANALVDLIVVLATAILSPFTFWLMVTLVAAVAIVLIAHFVGKGLVKRYKSKQRSALKSAENAEGAIPEADEWDILLNG